MEPSAPPPYPVDNNQKPMYPPVGQPAAYPQPYNPAMSQPAAGTMVIVGQPSYNPGVVFVQASSLTFGRLPASCQCPHCQQAITTRIEKRNGSATWIAAGICCIFGCWLGCCLIPFCVDDAKDVDHYCPNCNRLVGRYHRI